MLAVFFVFQLEHVLVVVVSMVPMAVGEEVL
jgi:hypothetical protein